MIAFDSSERSILIPTSTPVVFNDWKKPPSLPDLDVFSMLFRDLLKESTCFDAPLRPDAPPEVAVFREESAFSRRPKDATALSLFSLIWNSSPWISRLSMLFTSRLELLIVGNHKHFHNCLCTVIVFLLFLRFIG